MIDPVAEGIDPNPQTGEEIVWPLSDRPNQRLAPGIYQRMRAQYPDIDLDGHLINAFHYMLDEFDRPSDAVLVKKFLDNWILTNQKQSVSRKEAEGYFPNRGGSQ